MNELATIIEAILKAWDQFIAESELWTIQKPYPNEHAMRLEKPEKYDEYRRQNDKFGTGIHAIWGIIKGPPRKIELQAVRFDSSKFTFAEAKKWMVDHDYKPILSEPASGEKAIAVSATSPGKKECKVTAILDKMPKDQRAAVVLIEGHKTGMIRRIASEQKSLHPKPDLPRSALIYLSTRNIDADGDIVLPSGWDLSLYRGQGLWSHDYKADPIYKAVENGTDEIGLWQLIQFSDNERGENYWQMVKDGYLRTFSAGLWPKPNGCTMRGENGFDVMLKIAKTWLEFKPDHEQMCQRFIKDKWLVESSLCNVPSNPYALVQAVSKGQVRLCDEVRAAIGYEGIEKKCRDTEQKKAIRSSPIVTVKAVPVIVRAVPCVQVVQSIDIKSMVENSLKKCVARIRGAV